MKKTKKKSTRKTYVSSDRIKTLLDKGFTVYSRALGRFGTVIRVNENGIVSLKMNRGTGGTSFITGDSVKLTVDKVKKIAVISNVL